MANWIQVKLHEHGMAPYHLASKMGIAPVIINVWMGGQRDQTRFTFDIWSDFYANIVRKTVEMPLPNEQGNTRRLSGSLLIDDQKYITRPHDKSTAQRLALTRLFS